MLIRKLFKFESAHIVRDCSTRRCSRSLHGHSYKIELLLEAHALDQGQMVYDFGLLKQGPRELIDAFDHAVTLWANDDPDYIAACQRHSERWVLVFRTDRPRAAVDANAEWRSRRSTAFSHRARNRDRLCAVLP